MVLDIEVMWSGFSGWAPPLTSEAVRRSSQGPSNDELPTLRSMSRVCVGRSSLMVYLCAYSDGWEVKLRLDGFLWMYRHVSLHTALGGDTLYKIYT
jgi:hypothetical protein